MRSISPMDGETRFEAPPMRPPSPPREPRPDDAPGVVLPKPGLRPAPALVVAPKSEEPVEAAGAPKVEVVPAPKPPSEGKLLLVVAEGVDRVEPKSEEPPVVRVDAAGAPKSEVKVVPAPPNRDEVPPPPKSEGLEVSVEVVAPKSEVEGTVEPSLVSLHSSG